MKLLSKIVLLLLFSCLFFFACPKKNPVAPVVPEGPKTRMQLVCLITDFKIDMTNWEQGDNSISISFLSTICESLSTKVGGNIETVKASLYVGDTLKVEETQAGCPLKGIASSLENGFNLEVLGSDYKVDKLIVVFKGEDNNGYPIYVEMSKLISWDESSEIMIR